MTSQFFCTVMIFQQQLLWTPWCALRLFPCTPSALFSLFIEVQVRFLCWLNSMEDRNRWMNLKTGFFQIAVGEMWFLGQDWKPSLGFCLSVGAQGGGTGAGCALCHLQPSCCLGWELWQSLCPALPGVPNQPLQLLLCRAKPHRAPGEGRARHRNHLQFVLRIFSNTKRVEC